MCCACVMRVCDVCVVMRARPHARARACVCVCVCVCVRARARMFVWWSESARIRHCFWIDNHHLLWLLKRSEPKEAGLPCKAH